MQEPVNVSNSDYRAALTEAMTWLGAQPDTLFMGQAVAYPGTGITGTLAGVPKDKLLELPVFEDVQMGMATGMALAGLVPITIYPRWNFLLLATNQLVLHLDKLPIYSHGGYKPRVIVRVAVATPEPLDPQAQHLGDFTFAFRSMLKTVCIDELWETDQIVPAYRRAYRRYGSTLLVEQTRLYETA